MGKKHFGTDGIRGHVGREPVTPDFCLRLGWAAGKVLATSDARLVVIGKDTRISGYMIESVLEAGLISAGVNVGLLSPIPTPAIAYLTRTMGADAGIVISASHNPFGDNGIKFFNAEGNKLSDEKEAAIEKQLEQTFVSVDSQALGKAFRVDDARGRYVEYCKGTVERGLHLRRLKVVVDCAHGATYAVAGNVFSELRADVTVIGAEPNGTNINDGYGSMHPQTVAAKVLETGADVGIAFDGDGDRVTMVDERGQIFDGDDLLYIIARSRLKSGRLNGGGVVGTQMTNLGLEQALQTCGVPFERAEVGDRNVLTRLHANEWSLGGEPSGHLICLNLATTGDGIVAALQVLAAMITEDQPLSELRNGLHKYPQATTNVATKAAQQVAASAAVARAAEGVKKQMNDRGRVVVRASGTEPLVRIMVEGEHPSQVRDYAESLADVARQANGA